MHHKTAMQQKRTQCHANDVELRVSGSCVVYCDKWNDKKNAYLKLFFLFIGYNVIA